MCKGNNIILSSYWWEFKSWIHYHLEMSKQWYDHQKIITLPKPHYDWMHLRLQDFKFVNKYNSILFKISSHLKLGGEKVTKENMLGKIFTTFHTSNIR